MKKLFLSSLAVMLILSGCTKSNPDSKESEEIEIEEETEIQIEDNEASDGM